VAERLLGRRKLIEAPEGKIEEIRRLFREDRTALAAYNLEDCRLVEAIFEKADLIDFAVQRAVMTGLPLGRQGAARWPHSTTCTCPGCTGPGPWPPTWAHPR
jgi:DNA polymerase-2